MQTQVVVRRVCALSRGSAVRLSSTSTSSSANESSEDYFEKNKRLNRPLSPFIIYKPQMTSVMSITHRMTGLGLGALLYGGGISALWSQQTNYAQVLQSIQSAVPHSLLLTIKVMAGTALVYHVANGVRHLSWDYGYGYQLKQLYTSGYIVIGITIAYVIAFIIMGSKY